MEHRQYFADIHEQLERFQQILDSKLGNDQLYAKELYDPLSISLHIMTTKRLRIFLDEWQAYSANEKLVVFYNAINYLKTVFLSVCMVLRKIQAEYQNRSDDNTKHFLECACQEQSELYTELDAISVNLEKLRDNMHYQLKYQLIFMAPNLNLVSSDPVTRLQELQQHLRNPVRCKI